MPVLRTYRSKALAIVNGVVGGVLLPVLSIGTIVYDAPKASPANRVGTITFCVLVGAFVLLRVAPARLCVLLDGVRVVNYVRSRFIPWEDISGFSLRPWNLDTGRVCRSQGRVLRPGSRNQPLAPGALAEEEARRRHDRRAQPTAR